MKIKELKEINIWSRNGHQLFKGNVNDMPEWAEDFEVMRGENKGNTVMVNAWVAITYDDNGKKVITITEG